MASRRLALRILAAAAPTLLVLVALVVSFAPGSGIDRSLRVSDSLSGTDPAGGAERAPSSEERADPANLSAESPPPGTGRHSIGGTVLDPSGAPAAGAEVILVALEIETDLNEDDTSGDAVDSSLPPPAPEQRDERGRAFERRVAGSPRIVVTPEGRYEFRGIEAGLYRVVARGTGFLPSAARVSFRTSAT